MSSRFGLQSGGEFVMPHQIITETEGEYRRRVQRYKARPTEFGATSIFRYKDVPYVVGEEADQRGNPMRITGPDKYREGVIDVLAMAQLQKLLPFGHDNIILSVAHATDSVSYVDAIANVLGGTHTVERYDGTKAKYKVRVLSTWDEPAGGLLRFMTRDHAAYNAEEVYPGQELYIVDIGGGVVTITPVLILDGNRVQVLWNNGAQFNMGINDIIKSLHEELKDVYPDVFQVKSVPMRIMQQAIQNGGMTRVKGTDMDLSQAVQNSTWKLLDSIERSWSQDMDKGLSADHIIVTGGGGGLLFNQLQPIFDHPSMHLADSSHSIHLANLRGGTYATKVWIQDQHEQLRRYFEHKTSPVIAILDSGNSDLKSFVTRM